MLRCNGIEYQQLPENHPVLNAMKLGIKALHAMNLKTIAIAEAKRKESKDAEGNLQHSNGFMINQTQTYQHKGVSYRMEYYDSITYDGTREKLLANGLDFDGMNMELAPLAEDKIFFILFVTPESEMVPDLKTWQNEIRRPSEYNLIQRERSIRDRININKEKVELEKALYDLEGNPEKLMDVCYNFGVETHKKAPIELIDTLMNIILIKDSRGNFNREVLNKFRSIVNPSNKNEAEYTDLKALCGRLIDGGIVVAHGKAAGAWYLDEEKTQKLCTWQAKGNKDEALLNYLITHKDQVSLFKEKLEQLKPA